MHPSTNLFKKIQTTLIRQMSKVTDEVCDRVLVACAAMLLEVSDRRKRAGRSVPRPG
jgi:hypothetical protein